MMAERQVALVPTLVQLENFGRFAAAGEEKYPVYAKHMRALYAGRLDVFRSAHDAGVPIYAGTDAGGFLPHGLIGQEMSLLASATSVEAALGAGSWRARKWLGRPSGLAEGDPADLVVFEADPRTNPSVLTSPAHIILRGRLVS